MIKLKAAKPLGYNVLIKDKPVEEKKGNIIVPVAVKDRDKHGQILGTVAALGELAFTTGAPGTPQFRTLPDSAKVGDTVLFNKYAGGQFWINTEDGECRLITDNDVLMVVEEDTDDDVLVAVEDTDDDALVAVEEGHE